MEVENLLKFCGNYLSECLSEYLRVFLSTVRNPKLEFQPLDSAAKDKQLILPNPGISASRVRLNPKLFGFLFISVFIGSILNSNIPGSKISPEILVTPTIVGVCWFLLSSLGYGFCWVFSSRGSLAQTISINLQVFAVIHVLSSALAFLWGVCAVGLSAGAAATYLRCIACEAFVREPIKVYFVAQFLLALIYLPLANRRIHKFRFSWLRKRVSAGAGSTALSFAETATFYTIFLILTIVVVGLSKIIYDVRNLTLSAHEVHQDTLDEPPPINIASGEPKGDRAARSRAVRSSSQQVSSDRYEANDGELQAAQASVTIKDPPPIENKPAFVDKGETQIAQVVQVDFPSNKPLPDESSAAPTRKWSRAIDDPPYVPTPDPEAEKQKAAEAERKYGNCWR